jgi:hypothetical protein
MSQWEIEREEKFIKRDKIATEVKKNKFIAEIRKGLGDEIKEKITPKPKGNWLIRFWKRIYK